MAYGLKQYGQAIASAVYHTLEEARDAAGRLADKTGEAVTVVDRASYPRAKSMKGTTKPGARKSVAKQAVTRASEPRRLPSKAEALGSLFGKRNPIKGEYYFIDPTNGATTTARDLATIKKAAQNVAMFSGKRVSVMREDYSPAEVKQSRSPYKAKPPKTYKRNPTPKAKYSVSWYSEKERFWQFAGEFDTLSEARERVSYLKERGHNARYRKTS